VGAIAARAAVESSFLSLKINAINNPGDPENKIILEQAAQMISVARKKESEIQKITDEKIEGLKQQDI
jgi:hypothetical protein